MNFDSDVRPGSLNERVFAALYARLDGFNDRIYRAAKDCLSWPAGGPVLEIGAGTGVNFDRYPPGTEVIAVEPNPWLHPVLRRRAKERDLQLKIVAGRVENLPFADRSFPTVVGTLLLCSVRNVAAALSEIRRVLAPSGNYLFIEHVVGAAAVGAYQQLLYWPWRCLFNGCRLTRDTERALTLAGFERLQINRLSLGPMYLPVRPHILGTARG